MTHRRRLAAVFLVAALAGGLGSARMASADPAPPPDALTVPVAGPGLVDVSTMKGQYWACLAVEEVNIGTCIENPLPDPSGLPSLEDLLGLRAG